MGQSRHHRFVLGEQRYAPASQVAHEMLRLALGRQAAQALHLLAQQRRQMRTLGVISFLDGLVGVGRFADDHHRVVRRCRRGVRKRHRTQPLHGGRCRTQQAHSAQVGPARGGMLALNFHTAFFETALAQKLAHPPRPQCHLRHQAVAHPAQRPHPAQRRA
jgi:hypothetical protein